MRSETFDFFDAFVEESKGRNSAHVIILPLQLSCRSIHKSNPLLLFPITTVLRHDSNDCTFVCSNFFRRFSFCRLPLTKPAILAES